MLKTKTAVLGTLLGAVWTATTFAAVTFTIVRLTDSTGCSRQPSIDGSGKRLAFNSEADQVLGSNADGNFEIFLLDGKNGIVQITDTVGGTNRQPAITKGGTRIAFVSDRDLVPNGNLDANEEIFVFEKKKAFTQITTTAGVSNDEPAVSNSGAQIVLSSNGDLVPGDNADANREIFLFDKKKGFIQITDTTGEDNRQPAASANAARIAFVSAAEPVPGANADGNDEIFFFDKKKGIKQITTTTGCGSNQVTLTQSGTRLAFVSTCDLVPSGNADANTELFLYNVKKDVLTQITHTTGGAGALLPRLNGGGTRIAFYSDRDLVTGGNLDLNAELFLFDAKKGLTQITTSTGGGPQVASPPAFAANGKRIAFEFSGELTAGSNADVEGEIYIADQD